MGYTWVCKWCKCLNKKYITHFDFKGQPNMLIGSLETLSLSTLPK